MRATPLRLAVLASGSGTTLQNLLDLIAVGELAADIRLVIGSRPGLRALERASVAGVREMVIDPRRFAGDPAGFSRTVFAAIEAQDVQLVCLAGWLVHLPIPETWMGRVMNIHPALLPAFGGRGMYGHHVHEAVLAHGCKVSGCTVHYVNNEYDAGPIILQRCCPVEEGDSPDTLAARVFVQEKIAYPQAIRLHAAGRLRIEGRVVRVAPQGGQGSSA